MQRRFMSQCVLALGLLVSPVLVAPVWANSEAADAFVKRITTDVFDTLRSDKAIQTGDMNRIIALVDTKIMPNVNFQRMTASAVGPGWRQATPEQQKRLQEEFKTLLVRTYAGALTQVNDHVVSFKPLRANPEDKEVVVRSEVKGRGEPIQLDYRLEKISDPSGAWKIYDLNVLGAWLVQTYKTQFAQEINAKGIDGLIAALAERNKSNARKN